MPNKFIFDVDGTLTPSRAKINPEFEKWYNKAQAKPWSI